MSILKSKIKLFIYLILMGAPGILTFIDTGHSANIENRRLAQWPKFDLIKHDAEAYKVNIEQYLGDHLGLKNELVSIQNNLLYYFSNSLSSPRVSAGKNGFIYLNSHGEKNINGIFNSVCSRNIALKAPEIIFQETVRSFHSALSKTNRKGSILIVPTKSKIYPESLPSYYARLCSRRPSWQEEAVKKVHSKHFLYPVDLFLEWKSQFDVYHSKRFHWIGEAPYRTAQWLMKQWGVVSDLAPTKHQERILSDLNAYALGLKFSNTGAIYDYSALLGDQCIGSHCLSGFNEHYQHGVLRYFSRTRKNDLSLLILSDSFGPFMDKHFISAFDTIWSVELNSLKPDEEGFFKWIMNTTNPNYVLFIMHDGGTIDQMYRMHRVFTDEADK